MRHLLLVAVIVILVGISPAAAGTGTVTIWCTVNPSGGPQAYTAWDNHRGQVTAKDYQWRATVHDPAVGRWIAYAGLSNDPRRAMERCLRSAGRLNPPGRELVIKIGFGVWEE